MPPGSDTSCPTIADWAETLADLAPADDDSGRIDQLRMLEDLKAGCAAAQARITAEFAASQRAANGPAGSSRDASAESDRENVADRARDTDTDTDPARDAGADPDREVIATGSPAGASRAQQAAQRRAKARRLANRSAAAQVALARRESPQRGGRFVGLADCLVHEMPHTLAALQRGVINEWRAMVIVRETACLTAEQRGLVDAEIAGRLDGLGDARIEALVKGIAYRLDPESATRRAVRSASDRRVTLRPRPEVMGALGATLPLPWAVACYAALKQSADAHPGGDGRTHAQRMADEFFTRITGLPVPTIGGDRAGDDAPDPHDSPDGADDDNAGHTDGGADASSVGHTNRGAGQTSPGVDDSTGSVGYTNRAAGGTGQTSQGSDCRAGHTTDGGTDQTSPGVDDSTGSAGHTDQGADGTTNRDAGSAGHTSQGADNGTGQQHERADTAARDYAATGDQTETDRNGDADSNDQDSDDQDSNDPVAAVRAAYQRACDRDTHGDYDTHGNRSREGRDRDAPPPHGGALPGPAAEPEVPPPDHHPTAGERSARQPAAVPGFPAGAGVMIDLVITDRTLFGDGDDPALLPGNLPIPAPLARRMVADLPPEALAWIRRVYTRPATGELAAMDSRQREFPAGLRHLLFTRDQTCRTPWCNAPARHADHLQPYAQGGATSFDNGQSLSEDCNYARTAPGWAASRDPDRPGAIVVTTPTGHVYPSPTPDLIPGHTRVRSDTGEPDPTARAG